MSVPVLGLTPALNPGYCEKIDELLPFSAGDNRREGEETFGLNELCLGRGFTHHVNF